jgi:G3E family GTPase
MSGASRASRTPVTIITGFLGSGKTTLLNRLLADPALADSAVIINEFGEIGIDHLLVATPAENMVLLASGCLSCMVRGDLVETLADLYRKRETGEVPQFSRLLIETTGLADPVPVLQSIVSEPALSEVYALQDVVSLVDAVNGEAQLDAHAESVKQAAVADALLITKADIASAEAIARLEKRLRRLNPGADFHRVVRGDIDPATFFDASTREPQAKPRDVNRWVNAAAFESHEHEEDAHCSEHRHDRRIQSFAFYLDRPIRRAGLTMWLDMLAGLRGANLLRVKGVLNVEGDPVLVNAVQTVVHEPVVLDAWPDEDRRSKLVFIARDMQRDEIERTFEAFDFELAGGAPRSAFDPAAYARFVAAMKGFR